jgi:hypothetical protein
MTSCFTCQKLNQGRDRQLSAELPNVATGLPWVPRARFARSRSSYFSDPSTNLVTLQ